MPNIDLNKFQRQEKEQKIRDEYSYSEVKISNTQYFFEDEEVVFDVLDMDFSGAGPGMEVFMSFFGEDFKMRVDFIPKERFEAIDVPRYLIGLLEENIGCLECKSKLLEELCRPEKDLDEDDFSIDFIPDSGEEPDEDEEA